MKTAHYTLSIHILALMKPFSFFNCVVHLWVELKACSNLHVSCQTNIYLNSQSLMNGNFFCFVIAFFVFEIVVSGLFTCFYLFCWFQAPGMPPVLPHGQPQQWSPPPLVVFPRELILLASLISTFFDRHHNDWWSPVVGEEESPSTSSQHRREVQSRTSAFNFSSKDIVQIENFFGRLARDSQVCENGERVYFSMVEVEKMGRCKRCWGFWLGQ
jgi:hypothetical protein